MVNVGAKIWENIISVNIYIYIYIWNPATCTCDSVEYWRSIIEDSVITGGEIVNAVDDLSTNVTSTVYQILYSVIIVIFCTWFC